MNPDQLVNPLVEWIQAGGVNALVAFLVYREWNSWREKKSTNGSATVHLDRIEKVMERQETLMREMKEIHKEQLSQTQEIGKDFAHLSGVLETLARKAS